jgi:hypothetical protein
MEHMIHEQVEKQLQYLKYCVDSEAKHEEDCKKWGIRYTPSRRKWEDIDLYQDYKREIEKNGDKNLLVMVKMHGDDGINMYGTYPFARRYVHEPYLVYVTERGTRILAREDELEIVR